MKLLVINKQNPGQSKYRSPKTIGGWTWNKRLSNYIFMLVDGDKPPVIVEPRSNLVNEIQDQFNEIFKK